MAEQGCSAAREDPEDKNESAVYGGWRDSFSFGPDKVNRPPPLVFQRVLKELSPGLNALQLELLGSLAEKGFDYERTGYEVSALPLYEKMLDILITAQPDLAAQVPHFLPNFVWVFTWVKLVVLHHAMFQAAASTEQMDANMHWWTFLQCLWPDDGSCKRTKGALDGHRRLALLECGHETEAIAGFQSSVLPPWVGFEKAFLHLLLSVKQFTTGRYDKAVQWILRAEKAVPKTHETTPYINMLRLQMEEQMRRANVTYRDDTEHRFLRHTRSVDLQTVVGEGPEFGFLKLLLQNELLRLSDKVEGIEPLREPIVASATLPPVQQLLVLLFRGKQLLAQGRPVDALREFQKCLEGVKQRKFSPYQFATCDPHCRCKMMDALECMSACDGVDRTVEGWKIAVEGIFLITDQINDLKCPDHWGRFLLSNSIVDLGIRQYWLSTRGFPRAVLCRDDASRTTENDFAIGIYWASWEICGVAFKVWVEGMGQRLRNTWVPADDSMSDYSSVYLKFYATHQFHMQWVKHPEAWRYPRPSEDYRSSYTQDIARRALLFSERARACSVLPQGESQLELLKDEQALEMTEWDMIKESQGICGPGTIFLEYVGWPFSSSVCIVDGDGTVSVYRLDSGGSNNATEVVEKRVMAVLSAMHMAGKGQGQAADQKDHLEFLYEMLMEPVWATLKEPMKPQHKLIIVASGCFAKVPFTVLRNRATGRYLFQEVTVSVTPSLRLLHECHKRYVELQMRPLYPGEGAALAVGDPAYKSRARRLPESEKEVTAISNLFNMPSGGYKVAKLLQEEATVERLLEWVRKATSTEDGCKYSQGFIHIAAHGKVDDKQYARGALELAPTRGSGSGSGSGSISAAGGRDASQAWHEGQPNQKGKRVAGADEAVMTPFLEDINAAAKSEAESVRAGQTLNSLNSYLPSQDISTSGIEWSAYIAVLSACSTATGRVVEAATLNLGRAFVTAGVPCTVLSLWPVQDGSTSHLMQLFYKQLKQGEDASTALRSAMLIMLGDGGYGLDQLAPFVVSGLPTVCLPPQLRAFE